MNIGVRNVKATFLRLILPELMTYVAKIYQIGVYMLCSTHIT